MKSVIRKGWRDSAALIALSKRGEVAQCRDRCNYDVLLQTRTDRASFGNSVVFPGGVTAAADASAHWLQLLSSYGYTQLDFASLHTNGSLVTPLFHNDPVHRHISLRITAIRETFEELGLLICSRAQRKDKTDIWGNYISDFDVKYWQERVSNNPEELLRLCKELNCYPDIWSLYYWSNWLSPSYLPKRFDTAFFVTAVASKPELEQNSEVAKVEWLSPPEILERSRDRKVLLYPPQSYELNRLAHWSDLEALALFSKERSSFGKDLYYHATVRAKDGKILVFPGDDLYPSNIDYNKHTTILFDKTLYELKENCKRIHRLEFRNSKTYFVLKNFTPSNMDLGDIDIEVYFVTH